MTDRIARLGPIAVAMERADKRLRMTKEHANTEPFVWLQPFERDDASIAWRAWLMPLEINLADINDSGVDWIDGDASGAYPGLQRAFVELMQCNMDITLEYYVRGLSIGADLDDLR